MSSPSGSISAQPKRRNFCQKGTFTREPLTFWEKKGEGCFLKERKKWNCIFNDYLNMFKYLNCYLMNMHVQLYLLAVTLGWVWEWLSLMLIFSVCVSFYFCPSLGFIYWGANARCVSSFEYRKIASTNHTYFSSFSSIFTSFSSMFL